MENVKPLCVRRYLASHNDYDGYMCGFHQKQGKNYCELNHITFEKLDELVVFAINQQLKQMTHRYEESGNSDQTETAGTG